MTLQRLTRMALRAILISFVIGFIVGIAVAKAQTLEVDLVSTAHGPVIYQHGNLPGWGVDTTLFVNTDTGDHVIGPVRNGTPSDPVIRVWLSTGMQVPNDWINPHQPWMPGTVVFNSGNHEMGCGLFMAAPFWSPVGPPLHRIF